MEPIQDLLHTTGKLVEFYCFWLCFVSDLCMHAKVSQISEWIVVYVWNVHLESAVEEMQIRAGNISEYLISWAERYLNRMDVEWLIIKYTVINIGL